VKILTIGTFDTTHIGHAVLFKKCEALGELTVGVNTDEFVMKYKSKKPLFSFSERVSLITKLGYKTAPNSSSGKTLIEYVKPDVIVIGSDWGRKDYLAQIGVDWDYLEANGISLMYVPYTEGISSTEIRNRVEQSNSNSND
jgi:cytidyltransferase-like protein